LSQRLGLIDPALEQALHALRRVRNAFAHSTAIATLNDPSHQQRLAESYRQARTNSL
jgi:IS5 family transposase